MLLLMVGWLVSDGRPTTIESSFDWKMCNDVGEGKVESLGIVFVLGL